MARSIIGNSIFVLVLIFFGKFFSFLRDIVISANFGASNTSDAYFAANNIPSILFLSIISSYLVLLIPNYKKVLKESGRQAASIFSSNVIAFFLIISVILSSLGFIFMNHLISVIAPGFDSLTNALATKLGKILTLSFPFSSICLILATISNANNKYYAQHIIPIFSAIFVIIGITIFSEDYGIYALAVSSVLAFIFQLVIQALIARNHFHCSWSIRIFDRHIKRMTILVIPIFIGYSIDQINLLVNSIICSNLSGGSLSSLTYAQRLQGTISGTVSTAMITVIYPLMSDQLLEKKIDQLIDLIKTCIKSITLILLPIVIFLSFNSTSIISIIFLRGKFDVDDLSMTSGIFFFYSINIIFLSIREFLLRIFYVQGKTKSPLVASIISIFFNIILSIVLVGWLNVAGLSLANLIATIISLAVLLKFLYSQNILIIKLGSIKAFIIPLVIPVVLYILLQHQFSKVISLENNLLLLSAHFFISILIYYFSLLFFKQKEVCLLNALIKRKINRYVQK